MKNYLLELSKTPEGKRFLLSVYYASKSPLTNNNVLCQYLCSLKNATGVSGLVLKQNSFKYEGELVSLLGLDIFIEYYVEDMNATSTSSHDETEPERDLSRFNEKELKEYFEDISTEAYRYGKKFGANGYAWCSKFLEDTDLSPEQLGLDIDSTKGGGILSVKFPYKQYGLHYPTVIESLGMDINKNSWYYGNIDTSDNWGCTVNISKVTDICSEKTIRGLPEGLLCIHFSKEHDVRFVKKVTAKKLYFEEKYSTFLERMDSYYDGKVIDEVMNDIMGKCDECS